MKEEFCKCTIEGGVWCGLKAVQIVIDYNGRKWRFVCRKHKLSNMDSHGIKIDVINLKMRLHKPRQGGKK